MLGERPIGESETLCRSVFVEQIDNATRIEPEQADTMREDGNVRTFCNLSCWPAEADPRNIEHLPSSERIDRPVPRKRSGAKLYAISICREQRRQHCGICCTQFGVGEFQRKKGRTKKKEKVLFQTKKKKKKNK